jgi:hypothetical protein
MFYVLLLKNSYLSSNLHVQNDITGKPVKRIEAVLNIWSYANLSEEKVRPHFSSVAMIPCGDSCTQQGYHTG